jgi:hypothetical protein
MNPTLRDEIFMQAHKLRYSEDRAETAFWLSNEYAEILTDKQGQKYLDYINEELRLSKEAERDG